MHTYVHASPNWSIADRDLVLRTMRAMKAENPDFTFRLRYRGKRTQAWRDQRQSYCLLKDADRFTVYLYQKR
jgi:hypothetical protein